jgi:glycosyltransferase involved in cell wall biosynthesis
MSDRIRLVAVGHSYVVGMNRSILRHLASRENFDVTVIAPERFPSELGTIECEKEPADSPLEVLPVRINRGRWIYVFGYEAASLTSRFRRDVDIVYAWEEPYIYAGYQIARLVPAHVVYAFRTAQSLPKRYPPPFDYFEKTCLRRADGWVAGGNLVFENATSRGYPAERGRMITLAVDTRAFRPLDEQERRQIRDRLGLKQPVLGYLGRLTRTKGIEVMLRAVEMIGTKRDWSLLVLGRGPAEQQIHEWARRHGWTDRIVVRLVPHGEVPSCLPAMDLMLAPSLTSRGWKEQFGRMVIEAFASGVPVIASNSGELPHVIGDAGWVVPEGDAEALAAAIESALADPDRRAAVARKGLARVNEYSTSTVGGRFAQFYRELVDARRGARAA